MPIVLKNMSGMVPKLDPRNLPDNAAQEAHNVNITGGKLSPINVPGPFQVFHDPTTGKMKSGIQDGNIISIDEPSAPTVANKIKIFRPAPQGVPLNDGFSWQFTVGMWVTYFDADGVFQTDAVSPSFDTSSHQWEYTDDGIVGRSYLFGRSFTAQPGILYTVHGPKFKFEAFQDSKYYGGPDKDYAFPSGTLSRTSPDFPQFSMPLTAPIDYTDFDYDGYIDGTGPTYTGERYTYGHLQLVSVNGPIPEPFVDMTEIEAPTTVDLTESGYVEFHFKCNYQRKSQIFVNYVRTLVDQRVAEGSANAAYTGAVASIVMKNITYGETDIPASGKVRLINSGGDFEDVSYTSWGLLDDIYTFVVSATLTNSYAEDDDIVIIDTDAAGKEGPPSEIGELKAVNPGELVQLSCALPAGFYRQNIYRSSSDSNFRLLVDELTTGTYIDTFIESLTVELPPYGNYPHSTLALAKEGSVVLGGHTAVIFDNYDVRPSVPYKQWVYPEEYAIVLDSPFLAAASFGSSAVVFTQANPITSEVGKVYLISGQNPQYLNRVEISKDKPLLNKRSLCVIDSTAFYATTDGLCAVSPGGIRILTEQFFTRSQWLAYRPELMSAYVADNSIFVIGLSNNNPIHFRFDIGEGGGLETFTTYDAFSDADMYWKSKKFEAPRPISWRNARVHADGYPVELTLIGDNNLEKKTILIPDDRAFMIPRIRKCRDWEIEIRGRSTVSEVAIGQNVQELNS